MRTRVTRAVAYALLVVALLVFPNAAHAAMTIDSGPRISVTPGQATIWWFSSSTGSSELRWGTQADSWATLPNDISNTTTTLGTLHSRTISNLSAGTYYFRVRSVGAAGTATSAAHAVVVLHDNAASPMSSIATNNSVFTSTANAAGDTLYFGGAFTSVGARTGGELAVDTTTGTKGLGLPVFDNLTYGTHGVAGDGSGGWYVAGAFTRVGGLARRGIVHILPDGGVDPYFDAHANGSLYTVAVNAGIVYASGNYTSIGGQTRTNLAALDATTGVATAWNPAPDAKAYQITISGSTLYVVGRFTTIASTSRRGIAAFNIGTGALTAWDPGLNGDALAVEVNGTNVYVTGAFTTVTNGTVMRNRAAAFDSTTAAAVGWNPNVSDESYSIVFNGTTTYLGGEFTTVGGTARLDVAAVDTTSGALLSWNANVDGEVDGLALQGTTLYISGAFRNVNTTTARTGVAALSTTTATATAWNPSLNDSAFSIALQGTSLFLAGQYSSVGAQTRNHAAAIDIASGTLSSWNPNITSAGTQEVDSILVNGATIYVGGFFTTVNGSTTRNNLAAFDTAGVATTWNPNLDDAALAMTSFGGILYVGGQFLHVNGATVRNHTAAYLLTTGALQTWAPNVDNTVRTLTNDGTTIYAGGYFTHIGGTVRNYAGSITTAAGLGTWNPNMGNIVRSISIDTVAGTAYLGGDFVTAKGSARNYAAAISTAGAGSLLAWNPNPNTMLNVVQYNGATVYIGGGFTNVNGTARTGFAEVGPTTATLTSLAPNPNGAVDSFTVVGNRLYIPGQYRVAGANGTTYYGLSWIDLDGRSVSADAGSLTITQAPTSTTADGQATITWQTSASSSSELVWDRTSHTSWDDYPYDESNAATALGTVHSRSVDNLQPGTYYYRVRATDASANQITSAEHTFTITPADASSPLSGISLNGNALTSTLSSDGLTDYIGGIFTRAAPTTGSTVSVDAATGKLNASGLPQVAGKTRAVEPDGSGGYFIGGSFTAVGGVPRNNIAHILPDGGVDPSFDPNSDAEISTLKRNGTTLYVGGFFTSIGGQTRDRIAALSTTTGLASSWNPDANQYVVTMVLNGTTLYVGGWFTNIGGQPRTYIAALDTTTGLATNWIPSASGEVDALLLNGTTMYAGGYFNTIGGQTRAGVAALDTTINTNMATTWHPSISGSYVLTLALTGSTLYVGGSFTSLGGQARSNIAALSTSTGNATTWNPSSNGPVQMVQLSGTTLYVGGGFTIIGGATRSGGAGIDTTSGVATTFDPETLGAGGVYSMVITGGSIYMGGWFAAANGTARFDLAAVDTTTGELTSFDAGITAPGSTGSVRSLIYTGSTLYVGGYFSTIGGQTRTDLGGIDVTTSLATAFNPNINGEVWSAAISGTVMYVGGSFTQVNGGTARTNAAAFTISTNAVTAWNPAPDGLPIAMLIVGTNLYVGGAFANISSTARPGLASYVAATGAFNSGFNANISGVTTYVGIRAMVSDGTSLFVGGNFTSAGGAARSSVAALNFTTGAATAWNPGVDDNVWGLMLDGSNLYIGGLFSQVAGATRNNVAVVDSSTGALSSWNPDVNYSVYGFQKAGANTVIMNGAFTATNGRATARGALAVYNVCDRTAFCGDENLRDFTAISLGSPTVTLSGVTGNVSSTGTSAVTVQSNAFDGYTLTATDTSDTSALTCSTGLCTGQSIADWTGTDATPTTWAAADTGVQYGFGVTVLSTTLGTKFGKWGTGSTAGDFTNNKYAGLRSSTSTTLQTIDRYLGNTADVTTLAWRTRISGSQVAGSYVGTVTLTAVPNP